MDMNTTIIDKGVFCVVNTENVIPRPVGAMSAVEFCTGGCEDRT
jgi:hypothetical protein